MVKNLSGMEKYVKKDFLEVSGNIGIIWKRRKSLTLIMYQKKYLTRPIWRDIMKLQ